ncbi:hypothetical protein IWZ00DRAFT_181338 [Phyllosticta capitalensis]
MRLVLQFLQVRPHDRDSTTMRFSLAFGFCFLFAAALAAPLNPPADEGVVATAGAVNVDTAPISKALKLEDPDNDLEEKTGCMEVYHYHGRQKVIKAVCGFTAIKAFEEWSEAQRPIDHAALLKEHVRLELRWLEKKLGLRNNTFDRIGRANVPDQTVRISKKWADQMVHDAMWWFPDRWFKKYKDLAVALNRTQEAYDKNKAEAAQFGFDLAAKRPAPAFNLTNELDDAAAMNAGALARRDVSDDSDRVQVDPLNKTQEFYDRKQDKSLARRDLQADSDCIRVYHDHGRERVDKVVCGKKELMAFRKWSDKQAAIDHEAWTKEHLERQDRFVESKMGLRNNSFLLRNRNDIHGNKIRLGSYRYNHMVENGMYWTPEKWLKKYRKYVNQLNETQAYYDNKQASQTNMTQELDDTTTRDDGPLARRSVAGDDECVDVLHYHGIKRVEKRICNNKELKAFEKWSKKQALKDDAKVLRKHQEVVLRWAEKKMDMRNGSMSRVDRNDIYGNKIPVRGSKAATMLSRAVYWSPVKWYKKYRKEAKILNEAQEQLERKNLEQGQRDVRTKNGTGNSMSRRDLVPGSPVQNERKHDFDPVSTLKEGDRSDGFIGMQLRKLFRQLDQNESSPVPVPSEVSSLDDSVAMKSFLRGFYDEDFDSDSDNDSDDDSDDDGDNDSDYSSSQVAVTPSSTPNTAATVPLFKSLSKRAVSTTPESVSDFTFPTFSIPAILSDVKLPPTTTIGVPKIPLSTTSTPAYQFSRHPDLKTWPYTTPDPTTTHLGPSGFTSIMDGRVWIRIKPHGPHSSTPEFKSIDFKTETLPTPSPTASVGRDKHGTFTYSTRPYPEELPAWSKAGLIGPRASSRTKARLLNAPTTTRKS